ncbi:Transposon Tf2-8 polyprotein [Thelohanellus kitauei]|uniref:Transposon Tf2-8 polyprotein n=1 Tax=Thelohanellus kitauei TaxID=669202 RepID=A0A0C2N753_THEKT|nr:Transposon Tf2-8 polyprotein [Thelohanellus kitauei]
MQPQVTYLGHIIDARGIKPLEDNIKAIKNQRSPQNSKELKSFLGMVGYYAKFVPMLFPLCKPLYSLTKPGNKWEWSEENDALFKKLKSILCSKDVLVHFDEKRPIIVATDASKMELAPHFFKHLIREKPDL